MMLHTVMPLELVLEGFEKPRRFIDVNYGGMKITLEPLSFSQARVVRVLSTDPQAYMNPLIAPGSIVPLFRAGSPGFSGVPGFPSSGFPGVDYSSP